jgi:hypothetical protein
MGCLGYEESFQSTGEPKSDSEESNNKNFLLAMSTIKDPSERLASRPAGVQFGEDHDGGYYNESARKAKEFREKLNLDPTIDTLDKRKELINPYLKKIAAELDEKYPAWPVIGTFQFDPNGNLGPCIEQWNEMFNNNPSCRIDIRSKASVIKALASSGQSFNTWCGMQKIVQSFNSQVNTVNDTGVDRSNVVDGRLKRSEDRCVSLAARGGTGNIYAHFGPLRNSVLARQPVPPVKTASGLMLPAKPYIPSNMEKLLQCTKKATGI